MSYLSHSPFARLVTRFTFLILIFTVNSSDLSAESILGGEHITSCSPDITPPQTGCLPDLTFYSGGSCFFNAPYALPPSTDNCSLVSVFQIEGLPPGASFPAGQSTVSFVGIDASDNTDTCTFKIKVVDSQIPILSCSDQFISCDPITCLAEVNYTFTASDNCDLLDTTVVLGPDKGDIVGIGIYPVTLKVTDVSGNAGLCGFLLEVNNTSPPILINCPNDTILENLPGTCSQLFSWVEPNLYTLCSGGGSISSNYLSPLGLFEVGSSEVTYSALNAYGTTTCSFTVEVLDTEAPTISGCPMDSVITHLNAACLPAVFWIPPTITDNCPQYIITQSHSPGQPLGHGTNAIEYLVTDASGNTGSCAFNIDMNTVLPIIPQIQCPQDTLFTLPPSSCSMPINFSAATGFDNCGGGFLAQSSGPLPGTSLGPGNFPVSFSFTSSNGASATCGYTITIADTTLPILNCPANLIKENDPGQCSASIPFSDPISGNTCESLSILQTSGLTSGSSFPIGLTNNQFSAVNIFGDSAHCSFSITVLDTNTSSISCPADLPVNNDPGQCGVVVNFNNALSLGSCDAVISQTGGMPSGSFLDVGTHTINFEALQSNGEISACSFEIIVIDNEGPAIDCPNDLSLSSGPGGCEAFVIDPLNQFTDIEDNCGFINFLSSGQGSGVYPIGSHLQSWSVQDPAGNVSNCEYSIIVVDMVPPQIACPGDMSIALPIGNSTLASNFPQPNHSDLCSPTSLVQNLGPAPSDQIGAGEYLIMFTAEDASSNTSTCTFTINVLDEESPFINCPSSISTLASTGNCSQSVSYPNPVFGDNGPTPSLSLIGQGSGANFSVGTHTETYTVVDQDGNTASCSFLIEVLDQESPTIDCPPGFSLILGAGVCEAPVSWPQPTTSDNCGTNMSQVSGPPIGASLAPGEHSVQYASVDPSGNLSDCQFSIFILDLQSPIISCPQDAELNTTPGQCGTTYSYAAPTGSDNCPGIHPVLSSGLGSGSFFPVGTHLESWVITDSSQNSAVCSFEIVVLDNEAPTFTNCPVDQTHYVGSDSCEKMVSWEDIGEIDNCGLITLSPSHTSPALLGTGIHQVAIVATDASNNSNVCDFTITILDTFPPVLNNCPVVNITQSVNASSCDKSVSWASITHQDNCSVVTVNESHVSGSLFGIGITPVTITTTDLSGNQTDCSFNVEVQDNILPTIICPDPISISTDQNVCGATVTYPSPITDDNCPGQTLNQIIGFGSGSLFATGVYTEGYLVTDFYGNAASCSFTISVVDSNPPTVLSCPPSQTLASSPNQCGAPAFWPTPVFSDNCTLGSNQSTHASGTFFNIGSTQVSYSTQDVSGNIATCAFAITVADLDPPQIQCPPNSFSTNMQGQCYGELLLTAPQYSDACGQSSLSNDLNLNPNVLQDFQLGLTPIMWTVSDAAGNTASCLQEITISDTISPVFNNCPSQNIISGLSPGLCEAVVSWPDPIATDNSCNVPIVSGNHISGELFGLGTHSVLLLANDGSNNLGSCTFQVVVEDDVAPNFVFCPDDFAVTLAPSNCEAEINWLSPVVFDACGHPAVTATHNPGDAFPQGEHFIEMVATDAAGNSASCSFNINVQDLSPPELVCPEDMTVLTEEGNCNALISYIPPVPTDACGAWLSDSDGLGSGAVFPIGESVETYYATDSNGNTSSCSFSVLLSSLDTSSILCPMDTVLYIDGSLSETPYAYELPVVIDECQGGFVPELVSGLASGENFPLGTSTVVYEIPGIDQNPISCSFEVMVAVQCSFLVHCPGDIEVQEANSGLGAVISFFIETSGDCGGQLEVTEGLGSGELYPSGVTQVQYIATSETGFQDSCSFDVTVYSPIGCLQPYDLSVTNLTTTSATLSWVVPDSQDTQLAYRALGSTYILSNITAPQSDMQINTLSPGTYYEWKIRDKCMAPDSEYGWTKTDTFLTPGGQLCGPATELVAVPLSANSVSLSWSSPTLMSAQLAWREVGGLYSTRIVHNTQSAIIEHLSPNVPYEWKIKDLCDNPTSLFGWSDLESFTLTGDGCEQPLSLSATLIDPTSFLLSWVAPGVDKVQVAWRQVGGLYSTRIVTGASQTLISNLDGDQAYEWKVKDLCNAPASQYGWTDLAAFSTQAEACPMPDELTAVPLNSNSALLSWKANGVTAFQLAYRKVGSTYITRNLSTSEYLAEGLQAGTSYEWKVKDWCGGIGNSENGFTTLQQFTTPGTRIGSGGSSSWEIPEINLYPNPAREELNIEMVLMEEREIDLYLVDLLGRNIKHWSSKAQGNIRLNIQLDDLSSGIYFLRYVDEKVSRNIKFEKL